MSKVSIQETVLPGVGVRHDFNTEASDHIGVLHHHSGRMDLLIYDRFDPDSCGQSLALTEEEADTLGQLLGASQVVKSMSNLQQSIGGLSIDWIRIVDAWMCAETEIKNLDLARTGVLIVAVIRNGETTPIPAGTFRLQSGDTVVVIGTPAGIQNAYNVMQGTV